MANLARVASLCTNLLVSGSHVLQVMWHFDRIQALALQLDLCLVHHRARVLEVVLWYLNACRLSEHSFLLGSLLLLSFRIFAAIFANFLCCFSMPPLACEMTLNQVEGPLKALDQTLRLTSMQRPD